ncbi:MAG: endonuclease/exonuclease/phosphatase family protein [Bradymonadaceae bacterium]
MACAVAAAAACRPAPVDPGDDPPSECRSTLCRDTAPPDGDAPDGGDASDGEHDTQVPDGPRIRVATFNTHLLFDTVCDSGDCQGDAFEDRPSQFQYRKDVERVADAIRQLNADLVFLQEIEKRQILEDIQSKVGYPGIAFGETGRPASIDVGVLARARIRSSQGYDDRDLTRPDGSRTSFARDFLRVDLRLKGHRVIGFTGHFTAKVGRDDPGRRLAEAREAADIVNEVTDANAEARIVVGGDLNDTPDSPPLRALQRDGPALSGRELPMQRRWTYCYRGDTEAIDHLLSLPSSGAHYVPKTARAVGDRSCPGDVQFAGSDHAAFTATFAL